MPRAGLLFIVSAPSGAGKTSLCKEVLARINQKAKRPLKWSCSYTTRPPREGERHGVDYFFVSDEEFEEMVKKGEFAEWAWVHGHRYGTSIKYLKQAEEQGIDLLLEIDCQGARQLREKYKKGCYIFILPPSLKELRRRLKGRGTEPQEVIEKRIQRAKQEVEEYELYDYIIINDDFKQASDQLEAVIEAERVKKNNQLEDIKPILEQFKGEEDGSDNC